MIQMSNLTHGKLPCEKRLLKKKAHRHTSLMRSDKLFGEEPSEINMHYENLREKAEKKILANGQTLRS